MECFVKLSIRDDAKTMRFIKHQKVQCYQRKKICVSAWCRYKQSTSTLNKIIKEGRTEISDNSQSTRLISRKAGSKVVTDVDQIPCWSLPRDILMHVFIRSEIIAASISRIIVLFSTGIGSIKCTVPHALFIQAVYEIFKGMANETSFLLIFSSIYSFQNYPPFVTKKIWYREEFFLK